MGALDKAVGSLLIGTWINGMLYTVEALQAWRYFSEYPDDAALVKVAVAAAFLTDTGATLCFYAGVYLEAVTHWGDQSYLQQQTFVIPIHCITTGVISGIVQVFLCARAGRLIKSRALRTIVLTFLLTCSLTSTASAIWAAITVILNPSYTDRYKDVLPVTVWLSSSAGADILIAITLLWQLLRVKRESGRNGVESPLSGVVSRLIFTGVQTGSITSAVALLALGLFLGDQKSNVTIGTGFSLGRLYSLSMIMNLNARKSLNERNNTGGSSSGDGARRFRFAPKSTRTPGILVDGVTVNHELSTHVDEPVNLQEFVNRNGERGPRDFHVRVDPDLKDMYPIPKSFV